MLSGKASFAVSRRLLVASLLGALGVALWSPGVVDATTGPTPLAEPPRWHVTKREAGPFLGRFKLTRPHGKQLVNAAYAAEIDKEGYVVGTLVVYAYNHAGREVSWVARTYEYHPEGKRRMTIDVISFNEIVLARLHLQARSGHRLTGILEPLKKPYSPPRPQRITLRRVD